MQRRILGVALALVAMTGAAEAQTAPTAPTAPQLTVGGTVYAQWNYNISGDQHVNAFDVTRAYINVNGKFSEGVSTRVTPDVYRAPDGSLGYQLKYAYVAYQPNPGGVTVKFGMTNTPWVPYEEDLWGYRMQGTIAVNRNGLMTSSDLGLSADAKLLNGRFDVVAGIYNGEGFKVAEGDQRKDFMVRGSYLLSATDDHSATGGLRVSGYAGIGKITGGGDRDRYIGMVSYRTTRITLAAEYASSNTAGVIGSVISAFGVYHLRQDKWALIGRVDQADPNGDATNDANTRVIAGISYQVSPNLRVLGDVDLLSHEAGDPDLAVDPRNQALFQVQFTF